MLCVLARIDEKARNRLRALQNKAVEYGVAPRYLHGHVTLAVYTGEDTEAFISSCKEIALAFSPFPIRYEYLKVLREPCTIAACPVKEGVLDDLQGRIAAKWTQEMNFWSQREVWLPHTTLIQDMQADLDAVLGELKSVFKPFEAYVSCLEFSVVRPNGYEIVDSVVLD